MKVYCSACKFFEYLWTETIIGSTQFNCNRCGSQNHNPFEKSECDRYEQQGQEGHQVGPMVGREPRPGDMVNGVYIGYSEGKHIAKGRKPIISSEENK